MNTPGARRIQESATSTTTLLTDATVLRAQPTFPSARSAQLFVADLRLMPGQGLASINSNPIQETMVSDRLLTKLLKRRLGFGTTNMRSITRTSIAPFSLSVF